MYNFSSISVLIAFCWIAACKPPAKPPVQAVAESITIVDTLTKSNRAMPKTGQTVKVHYEGRILNGHVFDSTYERKQPMVITLGKGQVIKGLEQALMQMHIGEKIRVQIPPSLAYGTKNLGIIPPNSMLEMDVELLEIVENDQK